MGENVGQGGAARAVHRAFVDSSTHRRNLLDPAFEHVGIGVAGSDRGVIFVSEVFMESAAHGP